MALVVAAVNNTFNSNSGTKTVTITPVVGHYCFVLCANTGSVSTPTVSDDNPDGLGTYTEISGTGTLKNSSADRMSFFVRSAPFSNTTSTIVTMAPGSTSGGGLITIRVSGGTPQFRTGQVAKAENQTAGTPAVTFPSNCLNPSLTLCAVFNASNPAGMTEPSGWNEQSDVGYNTPTTGRELAARGTGFTGTTITWGSSSATDFCALAIELEDVVGKAKPIFKKSNYTWRAYR